jgi:hypothetical protein
VSVSDIPVTMTGTEVVVGCVEVLWNLCEAARDSLELGEPALSRVALLDKHRTANAFYRLGNMESITVLCTWVGGR